MKASFREIRETICQAIVEALQEETSLPDVVELNDRGERSVTAISLDIAPWHSWLGMSFRTPAESYGEHRYRAEEWRLFDLINSENSGARSFRKLANYLAYLYAEGEPERHQDRAHLIFLAGADALLDPQVHAILRAWQIPAPLIEDCFVESPFEYLVFDPDESMRANYCELVFAQRLQARLDNQG